MSEKEPTMPSEEILKNQTSRVLSDADILQRKMGEYVPGEGENGEPRLEVTKRAYDYFKSEMEEDVTAQERVRRKEVIERDEKVDLRELVKQNPELAAKIKCIESGWDKDVFIIKLKDIPDIGIIVSVAPHWGDQTRLHFNYTDEGSPKRTVFKEVVTPVPGDLVRRKDGTEILRRFEDNSSNTEYFDRAKEMVEALEKTCEENGITAIAIRQANAWDGWKLPKPKDLELLDARYEDVFEEKMGMPNYREHNDLSSEKGGYDTKQPYPIFDWHREN